MFNNDLVYSYYTRCKNLRFIKDFEPTMSEVYNSIKFYNPQTAQKVLDKYISKYQSEIEFIIKLQQDDVEVILNDTEIYKTKSKTDLLCDLYFLFGCIVTLGIIKCGMAKNYIEALNLISDKK